jgi:DNA-binding transcriptional ArsR family regulator
MDKTNKLIDENYYGLAELFKLFSDYTRLKILASLLEGEKTVGELISLLSISKSGISHQLSPLKLANLVKYRKEGQYIYYSLKDSHVESIIKEGLEHINE